MSRGRYSETARVEPKASPSLYHASSARFDRFNLENVGDGYGTLVYGPGIYLADTPGQAEAYIGKYLYEVQITDFRPIDLAHPSETAEVVLRRELRLAADRSFSRAYRRAMRALPPTHSPRIDRAVRAAGGTCVFDSEALETTANGYCVYDPTLCQIIYMYESTVFRHLEQVDDDPGPVSGPDEWRAAGFKTRAVLPVEHNPGRELYAGELNWACPRCDSFEVGADRNGMVCTKCGSTGTRP